MRTEEESSLAGTLEPAVAAHDLILDDIRIVVVGSRRVVQLVVDLPEDQTGSVSLDTVASVSRAASDVLDQDEPFGGRAYTLEVSSPGATRPLTEPRHWKRALNRLIAVKTQEGDKLIGRLLDVADDGPVLDIDGQQTSLKYPEIKTAQVELEFK
ncbi:ribosome maturation factor RimP [Saxibacter everestensis]|uniref:Ribosome maturation factor RimP n=1 Tax=Saxibacter everestensis TaxID=2909229 RepID=A0ABY8QXV6_9MICO|nr:ribosome maturation factor RimP [Brevibacteriaceae bacterium ZFBP1038]